MSKRAKRLAEWEDRLAILADEIAAEYGDELTVHGGAVVMARAQMRWAWQMEAADDIAHNAAMEAREYDR